MQARTPALVSMPEDEPFPPVCGMAEAKKPGPLRRRLVARFRVPSSVDATVKYVVVVNPSGVVTCNCPAGWHRRSCRHVRAIEL